MIYLIVNQLKSIESWNKASLPLPLLYGLEVCLQEEERQLNKVVGTPSKIWLFHLSQKSIRPGSTKQALKTKEVTQQTVPSQKRLRSIKTRTGSRTVHTPKLSLILLSTLEDF